MGHGGGVTPEQGGTSPRIGKPRMWHEETGGPRRTGGICDRGHKDGVDAT